MENLKVVPLNYSLPIRDSSGVCDDETRDEELVILPDGAAKNGGTLRNKEGGNHTEKLHL